MGLMFSMTSCGDPVPEDSGSELDVSESSTSSGKMYSVEQALTIVAHENDVARKLFTKGIVGPGKKQGLKFDEDWRKDEVEAGPLPALFLRGISSDIEKSAVPLGLYLGSDFPINSANKFVGKQADLFAEIRSDETPKHFLDDESKLYTAMFPDFAAAMPCVTCHNEHPETSKTDWELGDIMGATTWTYPKEMLTADEVMAIVLAYRTGAANMIDTYGEKIGTFKTETKPEIGDKWPTEGLYVPSGEAFVDSVEILTSRATLNSLFAMN